MTPKEKFNQNVWWVLQEIKEQSLATTKGKPVIYEVVKLIASGIPSQNRQKDIIHKLQEWKALKILKESEPHTGGSRYLFELKILQPKFGKVYKKYQKACELNSSRLSHASKLKLRAIFATPTYSTRSKQVADQFLPENRQFVLRVLKKIISLVDFSLDGKVPYPLQSPSGHPNLIKERSLLEKLEQQGLFRNLDEDGIFGIATLNNLDTKLIKEVIAILEEKEAGVITPDEFEEIKKEDKSSVTETKLPANDNKSKQPSELQQRYTQLLDEITSKQKSPDLKERYNRLLEETKSKPLPIRIEVKDSTTPIQENSQKQNRSILSSKRELRKKLNTIIKIGKFGKKEKAFLQFLAKDFEPKIIEEISKEVTTKACTKLKACVQKKLKDTGFNINTDKGGWGRKATYQLKYLLSSANS